MKLTIENKKMVCDIINSCKLIEEDHEYVLQKITELNREHLIHLGVSSESLQRCSYDYLVIDTTRFMFENDYADLYCRGKGFMVLDEIITFDEEEILIGRQGDSVAIGKFNGDIYESVTLSKEQLFETIMLMMKAYTHDA